MARRTLEAVFGALGAGLTGYGKDQTARLEREEQQKRQQLADALTAANMLASGRFGTEAQLKQSGGQAFRTAGQLAAGALPMGGGAPRVIPTADDLSNLGTAQRRGPAPAMFDVGGQRLGVMRTAADEQREEANRALQTGAMERTLRLEEDATKFAREQAGRMAVVREQGRQSRALASVPRTTTTRPTIPGTSTAQPGERGVLPTVTGAISQLRSLTPSDIRNLRAGTVQTVQETPQLVAGAKGPFEYGGARVIQYLGNVQANAAEQKYALQARAVSDAVARANERGVLSNQDNDRYIRQVSLISGDKPEVKELKVRNLLAWAEWLSSANQMLASGATAEQVQASGTAHANQLEGASLEAWAASNPQGRGESDEQYVARFRREMGMN